MSLILRGIRLVQLCAYEHIIIYGCFKSLLISDLMISMLRFLTCIALVMLMVK